MEFIERTVKIVPATLRSHANKSARTATIFRGVRIGAYFEFLNRVDGGTGYLRSQLLHVLRDRVVVHSVEHVIILQRSDAMDIRAASATISGAAAFFGVAICLNARH